jgi:hypothetical protein
MSSMVDDVIKPEYKKGCQMLRQLGQLLIAVHIARHGVMTPSSRRAEKTFAKSLDNLDKVHAIDCIAYCPA